MKKDASAVAGRLAEFYASRGRSREAAHFRALAKAVPK
jgi:hypothetical protein